MRPWLTWKTCGTQGKTFPKKEWRSSKNQSSLWQYDPAAGDSATVYGKGGPFGTKSKRRVIPLAARIQPLIEGYFALHETFRFSTRTIQRMLKRVANRARISRTVSPHVLRHTFAVTAIQKGISLPALQRLLGHDTLLTTEIYLNLSPDHVVEGGKPGETGIASIMTPSLPPWRPSAQPC